MKTRYYKSWAALLWICLPVILNAQSVTTPPDADNQKSSVSQFMGLVESRFTYNSPNVTGPNGEDRKGKIWGQLVPWGAVDLVYGTARQSPWRAGANENTVFYVSHDVKIEGKTLSAGNYGFFILPAEKGPWTLIFSKNHDSWGSYFYDPANDVLHVDVTPVPCEFNEWLNYGFEDRELGSCTAFLKWENLKIPFKIEVPDPLGLYVLKIREELKGSRGFDWRSYMAAAQFCAENKINLEEALNWADYAITKPFIGEENFKTLQTKSQVLLAMGKDADATLVMKKAIDQPTATVRDIHQYGRSLITMGKNQEAMEVFKLNRQKHPDDTFTTYVGLARGYTALGDKKNAIKNWEIAIKNIPESEKPNLQYYQSELDKLKT
jgi:tetratricopeptide (TPR) repeat protein